MTKIFTDKDLQAAVKNLKQDGVDLKLIETKTGDNNFIISTKNWRTKIGANDIGFWLEEQTSMKFKKSGFGLTEIIIAVAIIALFGGGGFYYREAQKQKSLRQIGWEAKEKAQALKSQIEKKNLEINGNTIETDRNKIVDTSDWKTYRNEQYGFEVRYPPTLRSSEYGSGRVEGKEVLFAVFFLHDNPILGSAYTIAVRNGPLNDERNLWKLKDRFSEEQLVINGNNFTVFSYDKLPPRVPEDFPGTYRIIAIERGGLLYTLSLFPPFETEMYREVLSTFKFIPLEK